MDAKAKSRVQEELLALYLRLNGFFTTSFIVHSPIHGQVYTEVDVLAVRFQYNREPERQILPDRIIETSDQFVDLVICEVKSKRQPLQFNRTLVNNNTNRMMSLLRWAGLHQEEGIQELAQKICIELSPADAPRKSIPTICGPGQTRVRGLLCCPERDNRRTISRGSFRGVQCSTTSATAYALKMAAPPVQQPMIIVSGANMKKSFATLRAAIMMITKLWRTYISSWIKCTDSDIKFLELNYP